MVAEIYAGLGAFKTMLDLARGLKDIHDATIRNGAIIELQEHILAAQQSQTVLVQTIRERDDEIARFKTWETEKQRYQLTEVAARTYAYVLKSGAEGGEPAHWICPHCYQTGKKSILQGFNSATFGWYHKCTTCELEISASV